MPQVSLATFLAGACSGDRLVSFPTDTVPALAVRPDRAELIYTAKRRSQDKPLILMGATAADLWHFTAGSAEEQMIWQQVAEQYWAGALTLVLPASDRLPAAVNPTDPTTVGLRVPDCAIAQKILAQTGPLATTSANQSGQPPLQTLAEIEVQFPEVLTLSPTELNLLEQSPFSVTDGNTGAKAIATPNPIPGVPSTVVKWTGSGWQVLRQGAITL